MKYFFEWFLSFFPARLPDGRAAFDRWATPIIRLAKVPDNRSTRFALSCMIMHESGKKSALPPRHFAKLLIKAAANEVAHSLITEIKAAQVEEKKAEIEKEKIEKANTESGANKSMNEATTGTVASETVN